MLLKDEKWQDWEANGTPKGSNFGRFGGCIDFDGSFNIYRPAVNFANMDFTIELQLSPKGQQVGDGLIIGQFTPTELSFSLCLSETGQIVFKVSEDGTTGTTHSVITRANVLDGPTAWAHVAVTRVGFLFSIFVRGKIEAQVGGVSGAIHRTDSPWCMGSDYNNHDLTKLNSMVDELRITKGLAWYTADFTPPTEAFTG